MVHYLDRYFKTPIESPMDVLRLFKGLSVGQAHQLNRAFRAFLNFLEILGFDKGWLYLLRKAIPKDQIGIDIRIPEEDRIREDLRRLPEATLHYQALWSLCLDSGLRLIACSKCCWRKNRSPLRKPLLSQYKYTTPKYLRKFAFDKMIELDIPESMADFIEGRVPTRIGAKHYMALARQVDQKYGRYANYVTQFRQKAELTTA